MFKGLVASNLFSYLLLFVIFFNLASCQEDDDLNKKLSSLQEQLDQLSQENKSLFIKNTFLSKELNNVLIVDVKKSPSSINVSFEDEDQLEIEYTTINNFIIDSINWKVRFYFVEGDFIITNFLGSNAKLQEAITKLNPNGTTPLAAQLNLEMPVDGRIKILVEGIDGLDSRIENSFSFFGKKHEVPILGLYPDHNNKVTVTFMDQAGKTRVTNDFFIQTQALSSDKLPEIEINTQASGFSDGFFMFDFRPDNNPMIVDKFGKIRWYLKLDLPGIYALQRLKNGNICFGTGNLNSILEYDMLGNKINQWSLPPEFSNVHHDVFELPNGNFIVTVDGAGTSTIEDIIIEMDRKTGETNNIWDLQLVLPKRSYFISDDNDWFHANAVIYDESDNTLIISGQRMGIVKVSWSNELIWILSQPEGWPIEYQSKLLISNDVNFEWIWGQHAPLLMPNGNLFLFDNGFGRYYSNTEKFSRAVEFRITQNSGGGGEVEQIWEYGRERGEELYSPIISDVDFLPEQGTRLLTFGSISLELDYISNQNFSFNWANSPTKAKIMEVNNSREVLFEMSINSTIPNSSVYRSEKINSIYP